ncbi:hypothetical protein O6H91_04G039800 [Diphasiastrum complanatum]|uniref:Uncharacterized protein n=1 Tax=Diphasiastrum complanatum TaxID=34168 RepID=A0ACC2DVY9_DIPCM|nr:hypothetical protein O6H91_04G039800 [Diphasiastrum complanatum]
MIERQMRSAMQLQAVLLAGCVLGLPLIFGCIGLAHAQLLPDQSKIGSGDLVKKLNQARSYIKRAQALPLHDGDCQRDLSTTLSEITSAESQISVQNWEMARKAVAAASDANSHCLSVLKSDTVPLARALSYLTTQAQKYVAAVQADLFSVAWINPGRQGGFIPTRNPYRSPSGVSNINDATDSTPSQGCPATSVDGTTCQFSPCGMGLGLVSCSIGFAQGVVGGLNGQSYTVTSNQDDPANPAPGTLRYASNLARGTSGVWITFANDMVIDLQEMLWVQSKTTIDGRGFNVTINHHNLVLSGVSDVIIHNIQINNIRGSDTIHIFAGSTKVWVDHVTSFAGELGLVSVLQGATDVTISNSWLQNYNFNMLLGASDADIEDKVLRVTVYRNWFLDSMQRMPHCRWGFCHTINNLYTNWGYYAIGARVNARVRSENNVFIPGRATEITPWFQGPNADNFDLSARIESKNDLLLGGATFHQFDVSTQSTDPPYTSISSYPPLVSTNILEPLVRLCAGAQFGTSLLQCQHSI